MIENLKIECGLDVCSLLQPLRGKVAVVESNELQINRQHFEAVSVILTAQ